MQVGELFSKFNEIIPQSLAEEWDSVGLQLSFNKVEIDKVLVALEITPQVLEEALDNKVQAILVHHPLIFSPILSLDSTKEKDNIIIELIQNNISVYAAHTNYDKLKDGNNDYLAKQLSLINVSILEGTNGIAKIGTLSKEMNLRDFVLKISGDTHTPENQIRYVGEDNNMIKKVAFCTGAGSDYFRLALNAGCDCFITGDVKYHDAQDAKTCGFSLIDLGHYHSEKSFAMGGAELCRKNISEVTFISSTIDINPFSVL